MNTIAGFILNEDVVKRNVSSAAAGIDGTIFTVGDFSLVSLTNVLPTNATITIEDVFSFESKELVNTGATISLAFGQLTVKFGPMASLLLVV